MSKRVTLSDVAKRAGVGVATVDRVLNGRLPVKLKTAEKVMEAATQLGYHGAGLISRRLDEKLPHFKIGFLLQRPEQEFYQEFARALKIAASSVRGVRVTSTIEFLHAQTPVEISERLNDLAKRVDAIGLVTIDHPVITAVVASLEDAGKPVFSMLSDFASQARTGYIGTDNRKLGRMAAWLMTKNARVPGEIGLFIGSHRFYGQDMRESGVRSFLRDSAPEFTILETQISLEDDSFAYEAAKELVQTRPDLVAVFVAGAGSEGVIRAFRDFPRKDPVALICSERTATTHAALLDGVATALLVTPIWMLSHTVVEYMLTALSGEGVDIQSETFLPFETVVLENL